MFEEKRDDYAYVVELENFRDAVDVGAFIPSDGIGFYGDSTSFTYSGSIWNDPTPEGATHIHWYNK